MLTVMYERAGCRDIRYFRDNEEFDEWLGRQLDAQPDTKIIFIEKDETK